MFEFRCESNTIVLSLARNSRDLLLGTFQLQKSLICVVDLSVLVPWRKRNSQFVATHVSGKSGSCALLYSCLQLHVSLFLNCLRILELLNQFHFENLHLHDLLLLERYYSLLLLNLLLDHQSSFLDLAFARLLNLQLCNLLLSLNLLLLHLVLVIQVLQVLVQTRLVLLRLQLSLLSFLMFRHGNRLNNLLFLLLILHS